LTLVVYYIYHSRYFITLHYFLIKHVVLDENKKKSIKLTKKINYNYQKSLLKII